MSWNVKEINPESVLQSEVERKPAESEGHRAANVAVGGLHGADLERKVAELSKGTSPASESAEPIRQKVETWSARELIKLSKTCPPKPIIEGLLNAGDILLLHGTEESYKSVLITHCAEAIATGGAFLRSFKTCGRWRVGVIETEMHEVMMGQRLSKMFPTGDAPEDMYFMSEDLLRKWRREDLAGKFRVIEDWVRQEDIQVLMIDTANDFFRGLDSPSEERVVGEFFDRLRGLSLDGRILVRHDRKRREIDDSSHSNEMIRGSAEWKEDPEAIIHLKRADKRTHEVQMEVGKLRYGVKPEPCKLWFDASIFRLLPLPPIIALLEDGPKTREQLVAEGMRFGLSERAIDNGIAEYDDVLKRSNLGHQRILQLDRAKCQGKEWFDSLRSEGGIGTVEDMQT